MINGTLAHNEPILQRIPSYTHTRKFISSMHIKHAPVSCCPPLFPTLHLSCSSLAQQWHKFIPHCSNYVVNCVHSKDTATIENYYSGEQSWLFVMVSNSPELLHYCTFQSVTPHKLIYNITRLSSSLSLPPLHPPSLSQTWQAWRLAGYLH